jgi:hypothetical protein
MGTAVRDSLPLPLRLSVTQVQVPLRTEYLGQLAALHIVLTVTENLECLVLISTQLRISHMITHCVSEYEILVDNSARVHFAAKTNAAHLRTESS